MKHGAYCICAALSTFQPQPVAFTGLHANTACSTAGAVGRGQSLIGAMYTKDGMNETLRRQFSETSTEMTTYQAGQAVAGARTQREAASERGVGRSSGPSSLPYFNSTLDATMWVVSSALQQLSAIHGKPPLWCRRLGRNSH